jgi:hypothetical protein
VSQPNPNVPDDAANDDDDAYVGDLADELKLAALSSSAMPTMIADNNAVPQPTITTPIAASNAALMLADKPFDDPYKLANYMIQASELQFDGVEPFVQSLACVWKKGIPFASAPDLTAYLAQHAVKPKRKAPSYRGLLAKDGKVLSTVGIWKGEADRFKIKELTKEHPIGESVTAEHSMDYETTDKEAFAVEGNDDVVLVVRLKKPKGAGTLDEEANTLAMLAKAKIPCIEVLDVGYVKYDGKVCPAMLMPRMSGSSKSLMRQSGKKGTERIAGYEDELANLLPDTESCQTAIASLAAFESAIRANGGMAVDDIQFLIGSDGSFVVNDAAKMDARYQEANLALAGDLLAMVREHLKGLERS